jgi:site-specific DNA-cytosine methylase
LDDERGNLTLHFAKAIQAIKPGWVVAEVYPSLWSRTFPSAGRTPDQQDAYATAEWLRRADTDGSLEKFLCPELEARERKTAEIEG